MKMELDVNSSLGTLIRAMRITCGKTQADLSKIVGVSRSQIANIEKNRMCEVLLRHIVSAGDGCGFDIKLTVKRKRVPRSKKGLKP